MPQNRGFPKAQDRTARATAAVVDASRRYAWPVVAVLGLLAVVLAISTVDRLRFNSDTSEMLSPELPFRKANLAFRKVFPDYRNAILIVVDGDNPDRVADGARALAARLGQTPQLIESVIYAPSDPFFRQNGLLYLSIDKLADLSDNIAQNQAFLATLSNDPSLRGLFGLLRRAIARLSPRDAEMLVLKYTENWSYAHLAQHRGASESAVESRLHRARARLRRELATYQAAGATQ